MSDRAVVVIDIGEGFKNISSMTRPTVESYAKKIGADFVVIDKMKYAKKYATFEKVQIKELLNKYRRILYLDLDLIVRSDCPDLFEEVPYEKVGVYNEGKYMDAQGVMAKACKYYKMKIPKWERQFYNAGVFVVSRLHRDLFHFTGDEPVEFGKDFKYYDQPYFNLRIFNSNHKIHELSYKFNRMSTLDKHTGEHRLSSYIVHYASAPNEVREELIRDDIRSWEVTAPKYKYKKNILVNITGGLVYSIYAEPTIRSMVERYYKDDNIMVLTEYPRFFKHLNVDITTIEKIKESKIVPHQMITVRDTSDPFWNIINGTKIHPVDLISISCLRRILSDKDKSLKIKLDEEIISNLKIKYKINDFNKYVLVHFSQESNHIYLDRIIEKYREKGLITIIIGDNTFLGDFKNKDVLDLRNKLDMELVISFIGKVPILFTDCLSSIAIAGAFDNWLAVVGSPQYTPYRKRSPRYKILYSNNVETLILQQDM